MALSPNIYPNRTRKGVTGKPEIIVLHLTAGKYDGAVSWLKNPASQASAHLVARKSDGHLERLVEDKDGAWTNGRIQKPSNSIIQRYQSEGKNPNLYALTIEVEWFKEWGLIPVGSALYKALVKQVATWCNQYEIPKDRIHIMGHYEIDSIGKPDCGKHIPWTPFIADVRKYGIEVPTPKYYRVFWGGQVQGTFSVEDNAYQTGWDAYNQGHTDAYLLTPADDYYTFNSHPTENPLAFKIVYNQVTDAYLDEKEAYAAGWELYNQGHKEVHLVTPNRAIYTFDKHPEDNPIPRGYRLRIGIFNDPAKLQHVVSFIEKELGVDVEIETVDISRK